MEEPTTSNFTVEKEGMINFYQSTWCHNQDDSYLYRHCYENLKYHSKAKNSTSISSLVLKIPSCPKFFRIFKIEVIANKQNKKRLQCFVFLCFPLKNSILMDTWKTHGTKKNLSCIESYFTLSVGSTCCYRQMLKIIVCWKVISCCVVQNFMLCGTQFHVVRHTI